MGICVKEKERGREERREKETETDRLGGKYISS